MTSLPYISDHYAPVTEEHTARDLRVRGALPPELRGRYLRNGHNPKPGVTPTHWFKGSGMIHGIRLREGRAEWYRNRWVRTPLLDGTADADDLTASVAGTHVIEHAGRLLALQEANLPFEIDAELNTVGAYDFGGKLKTNMTAHPKEDPVTGELHFFAYSPFPPHLIYYVASPQGEIVRQEIVEGAGPSLMHDFAITENLVVWIDMSVIFDPAETGGLPYRWHDDYAPRIGVMPRTGPAEVTWYPVEPGVLLHVTNAYEDNGRILLDGPRFDRGAWETSSKFWAGRPAHPETPAVGIRQHRWLLDPATGIAKEEAVDDLVVDFPAINEQVLGRPNRYGYAVAFPGGGLHRHGIVKYDNLTGAKRLTSGDEHHIPGEAVFVPAANGTAEDDGYLLTIVSDIRRHASEFVVYDAGTLDTVATVELPYRVPGGIHGSWIPDADPLPQA
jgi:carotenoid cleavage dioxygenase-like enzyme